MQKYWHGEICSASDVITKLFLITDIKRTPQSSHLYTEYVYVVDVVLGITGLEGVNFSSFTLYRTKFVLYAAFRHFFLFL